MRGANRVEKGLSNGFGQNNCFLNVVIQSLWHLSPFRDKFSSWDTHSHDSVEGSSEKCVHCSLKQIMIHYANSDAPYIPPTSLRQTLANLFSNESRFQMGDLDDAAEALEAVLENLHGVVNTRDGESNCIAHLVFGIDLMKQVTCSYCQATSEPDTSRHFIEYVYVSTIREKHREDPRLAFETLLRVSGQEVKSCPAERGACRDRKSLVDRYMLNLPEVLALGLVWPTTNPTPDEIMSLLLLIRREIDIREIFTTVQREQAPYRFRGMICFYGKHYDAYFYSDFRRQWLVFDDATVKCVGDRWEDVLNRCRLGHFHPSVLFYERVPGTYTPAQPTFQAPEPRKPTVPVDLLSPLESDTVPGSVLEPVSAISPDIDLLSTPNPFTESVSSLPILRSSSDSVESAPLRSSSPLPPASFVHPLSAQSSPMGSIDQPASPYVSYHSTGPLHAPTAQYNGAHSPQLTQVQPPHHERNHTMFVSNRYPFPTEIKRRQLVLGGIPKGYRLVWSPR